MLIRFISTPPTRPHTYSAPPAPRVAEVLSASLSNFMGILGSADGPNSEREREGRNVHIGTRNL